MKNFKHFFKTPQQISRTFSIRGIGIEEEMPLGIVDRPRGTGDWLMMYFHQPVWIMDRAVKAGSLIIWKPGDSQKYGNITARWLHSWIHCDGSSIPRWLKQSNLPTNTIIPDLPATKWRKSLGEIFDEIQKPDGYSNQIILNLMFNSLLQIGRHSQPMTEHMQAMNALDRIRQDIETHFDQPVILSDLAERADLSISHFCARFKELFGCGAIEYLIEQRMTQAAYYLYDRNLKIQDIAARVGYDDVFHFSKMFKKHHGISPSQLRKQQLGE